jgi:hypothetical protein
MISVVVITYFTNCGFNQSSDLDEQDDVDSSKNDNNDNNDNDGLLDDDI